MNGNRFGEAQAQDQLKPKVAGPPTLGQQPADTRRPVGDLQHAVGRLGVCWMKPDRVEADSQRRVAVATPFLEPLAERVAPSDERVALALRPDAVDEQNSELVPQPPASICRRHPIARTPPTTTGSPMPAHP
jgi:hypothetical protein